MPLDRISGTHRADPGRDPERFLSQFAEDVLPKLRGLERLDRAAIASAQPASSAQHTNQ